jgi:hypothetical protein
MAKQQRIELPLTGVVMPRTARGPAGRNAISGIPAISSALAHTRCLPARFFRRMADLVEQIGRSRDAKR